MKVLALITSQDVTINGCTFGIPYGIRYVTIDWCGCMEGWFKDAPFIDDGYWHSSDERGIVIGNVKLEEGDGWTQPYNVEAGRWYDSCYDADYDE